MSSPVFFRSLFIGSILLAASCPCLFGEDVIWRLQPTGGQFPIPNKVVIGPGPGPVFERMYLLPQVLVDATTGNPGTVDIITAFFVDDTVPPGFGTMSGFAVLNFYIINGPMPLPANSDNPDNGLMLPATFTQNPAEGWIEVQVSDLASILPAQIFIEPGFQYFIGITPVFVNGNQPFGGFHIANETGKGMESQSAFRETSPMPINWIFAGDLFGPPQQLFATIVIEPLRLGDVNCDGLINLLDVFPFVTRLTSGDYSIKADINQDGMLTLLDVSPFVQILAGG